MELKFANEILNVNGMFIAKSTATGKYFWMAYDNGSYATERSEFDTVQEAFDDALTYLKDN